MKNQKGPKESEINPQLIAVMERDLGINQDEPEEVSQKWTPPPRPSIPFHSVGAEAPMKIQQDVTTELYDLLQISKKLEKTGS